MTAPKTSLKQKYFLIVVSFCATLLIVELFLRLSGFLLLTIQEQKNKKAFLSKDSHIILCIGESTTYLGGEASYPSQLEKILNISNSHHQFKVINKGVPGIGTNHIANNIEDWLQTYQPDMVVAMMGINDHNKLIPLDQETVLNDRLPILLSLRIYKLFRWIRVSVAARLRKNDRELTDETALPVVKQPPKAKTHKSFDDIVIGKIRNAPENYRKLYIASLLLIGNKEYAKAESLLKILIQLDYNSTVNRKLYRELGKCFIHQEKFDELTKPLEYLLKNPSEPQAAEWIELLCRQHKGTPQITGLLKTLINNNPNTPPYYDLLGGCYALSGETDQSEHYINEANRIRLQHYNPVTKSNYYRIADMIVQNHIQGIFVQYPLRDIEILKNTLKNHPSYSSFQFINNKDIFKDALSKTPYNTLFTDRFAGDFGHCTPQGNRILAENIAQSILQITASKN